MPFEGLPHDSSIENIISEGIRGNLPSGGVEHLTILSLHLSQRLACLLKRFIHGWSMESIIFEVIRGDLPGEDV